MRSQDIDRESSGRTFEVHTNPELRDSFVSTHSAFNYAHRTEKTAFEYMQQFPEKAERIGLAMDDGSRRSMKQIINRYYCPSSVV